MVRYSGPAGRRRGGSGGRAPPCFSAGRSAPPLAAPIMRPFSASGQFSRSHATAISVSFWPPNPKLLLSVLTTLALRAWLGT